VISGRRLRLLTSAATEFIDITGRLQETVSTAGLANGRVHLQSLHTTLGLTVTEHEPLLLRDLPPLLERLAPAAGVYWHAAFAQRLGVPDDEPANGHAHCRLLLLQPSLTVLIEDGRLLLGRWQSVFAVELDGPRERQIALQLEGEFQASGPDQDRQLVAAELTRQLLADPEPVQAPMRRLVEAGGKRLRPALVLLAHRLGPRPDLLRAASLAAAVELPVAAVLSVIFNAVILGLWFTDFGRSPAPLEGGRAQKRLDRAMAEMRRTGSFVAMLDEQIFKDMSPEQLELAADRAWRRKRRQSTEAPSADDIQRRDVMLRVQCDGSEAARPAVESVFDEYLKKFRLGGIVREGEAGQSLEYIVQFKKSVEPDDLLNELRSQPHVLSVEVK